MNKKVVVFSQIDNEILMRLEQQYHVVQINPKKGDINQQILEESKQHYRFQATVIDSEMLVWWLRKFGDDVWDIEQEVIEPQ